MNAARLARRFQEAGDDRTLWAEAISDEITDPTTGLVSRDHLDRRLTEFELRFTQFEGRIETRFAQFETRSAQFETRLTRTVLAAQVGGFIALAVLVLLR
jgi:hypothetical protein